MCQVFFRGGYFLFINQRTLASYLNASSSENTSILSKALLKMHRLDALAYGAGAPLFITNEVTYGYPPSLLGLSLNFSLNWYS